MSTFFKVHFSIEEIKEMMENKITNSQDNDIEEIIGSDLSQFNDGGEDKFTLSIHAKTKSKSRNKQFTKEQIKHILAQVAADENGEAVDEIERVSDHYHTNGDISVFYKAFDTGEYPPKSDYDKVNFSSARKQWVEKMFSDLGIKPRQPDSDIFINNWNEYLSSLVDTTECDDCPFNRICPDSLAK